MPDDAMASPNAPARQGQAQTYALLVREVPRLRRYARFLTGDVTTADRLVQECLSQAILAIDTRPSEASMRAWLYVIMHDQHFVKRASFAGASGEIVVASDIQNAFDRLDQEHQQVMFMVGVDGLEHADTAAALGVSLETIHARLLRARAVLKQEMDSPIFQDDTERTPEIGLNAA